MKYYPGAVLATWIENSQGYEIHHTERYMNNILISTVYYVYKGGEMLAEFESAADAKHFMEIHKAVGA